MNDDLAVKYARRKKTFIRYSVIIIIGYAITQVGSFIARLMGLSSITMEQIALTAVSSIGITVLVTLVVVAKRELPDRFIFPVITLQFVIWLILYGFWVYYLHEARILGLFFAFMPLIFLITNSNLLQSLSITVAVAGIQLGVSYYAIYHAGQKGSFPEVVFYTSWFTPSAVYIAYVAGIFLKQRRELSRAKRVAEQARDALWGEMELAKKIQTVLLPERPAIRDYQISAYMAPAAEVGGDYYDVINVAGRDWVIIGDVSGHGVSAGLIMMMTQTSIKSTIAQNPDIPPAALLAIINGVVSENIRRLGGMKYMTLTVMAMHEQGEFFFSGLHQDIMLYRAADKRVEIMETRGMWIGIMENITGMNEEDRLSLSAGDVMLLYTDGITEATDAGGAMYTDERLQSILTQHGDKAPDQIRDAILASMTGYAVNDDVTLLIIRRL